MSATSPKESPLQNAIALWHDHSDQEMTKNNLRTEVEKILQPNQSFDSIVLKELQQIPLQFFHDQELFKMSNAKEGSNAVVPSPLLTAVTPYLRALGEKRELKTDEREPSQKELPEFLRALSLIKPGIIQNFSEELQKHPLLAALLVCKETDFVMPMVLDGYKNGPNNRQLSADILEFATIAKETQEFFQTNTSPLKISPKNFFDINHKEALEKLEQRFATAIEKQAQEPNLGQASLIPEKARAAVLKGIESRKATDQQLPLGLSEKAAAAALNAAAAALGPTATVGRRNAISIVKPGKPQTPNPS
jgi:hypothetical protein